MSQQPMFSITDARGRQIGTVRLVHLGRGGREFWQARSLDGVDLGAHPRRVEAEEAIQDDWEAGRPRDPRSPSERYRPLFSDGQPPVYLGPLVPDGSGVEPEEHRRDAGANQHSSQHQENHRRLPVVERQARVGHEACGEVAR